MANLKDLIVNGSARIMGNLYATVKGNTDTATKLETARTIRTNLGSTTAVSFDGSADITPGVSGTLPVANGGTGQTSIANIKAGKDGDGNTISSTYLKNIDQTIILPNFDTMSVLQTIEFDTSDTNWHTVFTRTNTETAHSTLDDIIYFRMTVTGTSINQICDCAILLEGRLDNPTLVAFLKPGTTDGNYSGARYVRTVYPKNLNNGYGWAFEVINNRNSNARHYKIEVFKTNSKITWVQGTTSAYNSTYQNNGQVTFETTCGYYINSFNGSIGQSTWGTSINSFLPKFVTFSTNPLVAEALLINQMVFMNSNKFYPATNKTTAIEPGCGIQFTNTAYAVDASIGWDRIRQKQRISDLTNIPHATLARGNPCYFRCTMDANGNILSDNYVTTSMTSGYTWYYLGVAESSSAFTLDTTQSFFMTLNSSGKLTHINGKAISDTDALTKTNTYYDSSSSTLFIG